VLAVLVAALSYVINSRFKEIIQLAVKEKSKGAYVFNARGVDLSLLHNSITIKNAVLYSADTVNTPNHYEVKIPAIYFSVASIKDIIFHQKVSVDSLSVISPTISLHEHRKVFATQKVYHDKDLQALLNKLLAHLQVKSLHIKNASYIFKSKLHPSVLKLAKIDFTLSDFSNEQSSGAHLFSTGDIDLKLGRQSFSLPDGIHFIDFNKLHFSGKNQYFELDSFTFLAKAIPGRTETKVFADRIRFKSSELASIFSKDELIIDTILLVKPMLRLGKNSNQTKTADQSKIKHLFKNINFKFIDIQNGSFANADDLSKSPGYGTQKVDLKVYNLSFEPAKPKSLGADSIKLNLSKIKFLSKDGKVQLTVDEMAIAKNQVVFKNAFYAPVHPGDNSLSFFTPALKLKNVNLAALMNKQISADQADLITPVIKVISKPKSIQTQDTASLRGFKKFFKMLNSMSSLIAVEKFNILDGSVSVVTNGKHKTAIDIDKFNVNILANRFLNSDTTVKLKHAIPLMKFSTLKVKSRKVNLLLSNYKFNGRLRQNWAGALHVNLANGTNIRGKQLYWEWLDWDLYQTDKLIFIDSLKAGFLDVSINKESQKQGSKKTLPRFQIGKLEVGNLRFNLSSAKASVNLAGNNIFGRNLESKGNLIYWKDLGGHFNSVKYISNNTNVFVEQATLNAQGNNEIRNISVELKKANDTSSLKLPLIKFKGPFYSTNFKTLSLDFFHINNPEIRLSSTAHNASDKGKPLLFPLDLTVKALEIQNAKIYKQTNSLKDTVRISSDLNLKTTNMKLRKLGDFVLSAESILLNAKQFVLSKSGLRFHFLLRFPRKI